MLFLGNSYTGVNDLPLLVERLATDGGHAVVMDRNTPGGNTLGAPQSVGEPHATNATSLGLIASDAWDYVVLQEQSTIPSIRATKDQFMKPGAQSLSASIAASDPTTETLLFQTWGRASGGTVCFSGQCATFADFFAMQDALTAGYDEVALLVSAVVAPVGEAWRTALLADPTIVLHENDGSHPNLAGSYLAACVFYATLFGESPVGLAFDAGLSPQARRSSSRPLGIRSAPRRSWPRLRPACRAS